MSAEVDLHQTQLSSLLKEKNSLQQQTNRLKAEKLETIVDVKAARETERSLRTKLEEVQSHVLFQYLSRDITPAQFERVGEILTNDSSILQGCNTSNSDDSNELKEKLEGKVEQVRLLQNTISKLKASHDDAIRSIKEELEAKNVRVGDLQAKLEGFRPIHDEKKRLETQNDELKSNLL